MKRSPLKKRPPLAVWTSKKADIEFSKWVRARDGACVRCGKKEHLQNSHFWARGNSATRYLPENCDALCYGCHYGNAQGWEYSKQGEYRDFKLKQLGRKKYQELEKRARSIKPRSEAIRELMEWLVDASAEV